MADCRHFKHSKNGHISAKVQAIDTKFGALMHICPLKIQDGGRRHLEKLKTVMSPQRFDRSAQELAW